MDELTRNIRRREMRELLKGKPHIREEDIDFVIDMDESNVRNGGSSPLQSHPKEESRSAAVNFQENLSDRFMKNAIAAKRYLGDGFEDTALPAFYVLHKIGENIFEPDNLEGQELNNKMKRIVANGAYPDGETRHIRRQYGYGNMVMGKR